MSLNFLSMNVFAVITSIISNMVIGMLWYSPLLFGNIWLKLVGKKIEDISKEESNKSMSFSLIPAVLSIFSLATIISISGASTILGGLFIASILSIGVVGTSSFNLVLFEGRGVKLTLIHLGYSFVTLNIASIILVLWK